MDGSWLGHFEAIATKTGHVQSRHRPSTTGNVRCIAEGLLSVFEPESQVLPASRKSKEGCSETVGECC